MLAVARNSSIVDAKGLVGATIGVPTLVGETTVFVRSWLAQQGIAATQVRFVELPPPQVVAGLQRGTIDAGFTGPPFSTQAADIIRAIGYPDNVPAALSPDHQYRNSVWYASKQWIEADLPRARTVVAAIYEAARWANAHQDATLKVLLDIAKLDPAKVAGMKRTQFATSLTSGMVQPVITLGEREKLLRKPITAGELLRAMADDQLPNRNVLPDVQGDGVAVEHRGPWPRPTSRADRSRHRSVMSSSAIRPCTVPGRQVDQIADHRLVRQRRRGARRIVGTLCNSLELRKTQQLRYVSISSSLRDMQLKCVPGEMASAGARAGPGRLRSRRCRRGRAAASGAATGRHGNAEFDRHLRGKAFAVGLRRAEHAHGRYRRACVGAT